MSDDLLVRLEPPTAGRMAVFLSRDGDSLHFIASPSPDDSLGDLVRALIKVMNLDRVHSSALWNADAVEYDMRFDGNATKTTLTVIRWPDQRRLLEKGETVLTVQGSREEIVLPFWRALRELEDHSGEQWEWSRPFPAGDMRKLSDLVGGAEEG